MLPCWLLLGISSWFDYLPSSELSGTSPSFLRHFSNLVSPFGGRERVISAHLVTLFIGYWYLVDLQVDYFLVEVFPVLPILL